MGIVNVTNLMKAGIGGVSTRIRNIGRGIAESERFIDRQSQMIGMNIARINYGSVLGIGVGIGGANLINNFRFTGANVSPSNNNNNLNSGNVTNIGTQYEQRRFGNMDSNLGYNRIVGMKPGPRF